MTLLEGTLKDYVFIDPEQDPMFGSDQIDVDYPCRFGTVMFLLTSTSFLSTLADRIRKDQGFVPMAPMDEYTDETCDQNGWYDFYYGINAFGEGFGDSTIEFVVAGSDSPDNEQGYTIDLTPEEQNAMFKRIDEECLRNFGRSAQDLLAEADRKLNEEELEV